MKLPSEIFEEFVVGITVVGSFFYFGNKYLPEPSGWQFFFMCLGGVAFWSIVMFWSNSWTWEEEDE